MYRINKEGNESLPLLAFRRDVVNAVFLKYSEEGRLSSSHVGIRTMVDWDSLGHVVTQTQTLFRTFDFFLKL